jgi:WD40 repeat protein
VTVLAPHDGHVLNAVFSPDGAHVVTGDWSGQAKVWETTSGRLKHSLHTGDKYVWGLSFSPDGRRLVVATEGPTDVWKGALSLWDLAGGKPSARTQLPTPRGLRTIAFSPDGRKIVFGGYEGKAQVVDASSLAAIGSPLKHDYWVHAAAFSPDGTQLVTGSADRRLRVWRTSDWSLMHELPEQKDRVMSASFSRDGTRLVSSSNDGQATIWHRSEAGYAHMHDLIVPESEKSQIWSATFSPDDRWILTASFDNTARIWVPRGGTVQTIAVLRGHTYWVRTAAFSANGRRVVTASSDRSARIWPVFPERAELIRHALATVPRCLSPNERRQLGLDPKPPGWCITGTKEDESDPSRWKPKWPFTSAAWRLWQSERKWWWRDPRPPPHDE